MTKDELKAKIAEIERMAELQKEQAYFEYVRTNAKYKIGDVVSDSTDTIRVEEIKFSVTRQFNEVSIWYWGPMLTKKGEPRKDGQKRAVFEWAIKQ